MRKAKNKTTCSADPTAFLTALGDVSSPCYFLKSPSGAALRLCTADPSTVSQCTKKWCPVLLHCSMKLFCNMDAHSARRKSRLHLIFTYKKYYKLGIVVHACNSCTEEAEAGVSEIHGQPRYGKI